MATACLDALRPMFNEQNDQPSIRRVAIIGSGVAGLSLGLQLQAEGIAVTLFEKSRGPGGRLASKRVDNAGEYGHSVDMGAQFFTLRNPRFRALLERWAGPESYAQWHGRLRYQAADGQWQAFRQATRHVGVPRMTAISRALSAHLMIHNGVRVSRLIRTDTGWQVVDTTGSDHGVFDVVVLTMPPAQSRDLLIAGDRPELAAKLDGDVAAMAPCWAVAACFDRPLGLDYDGFQSRLAALQWAGRDTSKPGRAARGEWWVWHGQPDWSDAHRDDAPEAVIEALWTDFCAVTGIEQAPVRTLAHRWLYAKSSRQAGPGHYWFAGDRLAVIGDWLSGGRVEGAFDSAVSLFDHWLAEGAIVPDPQHVR